MKERLKADLKRLERLVEIRQVYVSVAEESVKRAEKVVHGLEDADRNTTGNIQRAQAAIAYLRTAKAANIQHGEKYIRALEGQRKHIRQSLDTATTKLARRLKEWTEAMREQKVASRLQERRLHLSERVDDVAEQKSQDEASVSRYTRTRFQK